MKQLLFLFLITLNACSKTHDDSQDDKLSFSKVVYTGNELKINGYYYMQYEFDMPHCP